MKWKNYIAPALWLVVIASAVQYAFIAWVPNIIFAVAKKRFAQPLNTVVHAPQTDASLRRVVLPNPDFIYSACFYDVSKGDVIISCNFPDSSTYCSLAFYGSDMQPYHVINNVNGGNGARQFRLSATANQSAAGTVETINARTKQGWVLLRVLLNEQVSIYDARAIQESFDIKAAE